MTGLIKQPASVICFLWEATTKQRNANLYEGSRVPWLQATDMGKLEMFDWKSGIDCDGWCWCSSSISFSSEAKTTMMDLGFNHERIILDCHLRIYSYLLGVSRGLTVGLDTGNFLSCWVAVAMLASWKTTELVFQASVMKYGLVSSTSKHSHI